MINPNYEQWHRPVFEYQSLQEFLAAKRINNGIHSITVNGQYIDFLLHGKPSKNLLVVFNGAVNRENNPPFFSGRGLSANLNCAVICINDPSLYLDSKISIAWYVGSKYLPLQSILPSIIDKVASFYASKIIMTGGSSGGFASLYYATKTIKPTIALVYNPQTNIRKYHIRQVNYFAKICFECQNEVIEPAFSNITFDLVKHYSERKVPVIYLQNSDDTYHIKFHATPFIKVFGLDWTDTDQTTNGLYFHLFNWKKGHRSPPKDLVLHIVHKLCRFNASWNEVINSAHSFIMQEPKISNTLNTTNMLKKIKSRIPSPIRKILRIPYRESKKMLRNIKSRTIQ